MKRLSLLIIFLAGISITGLWLAQSSTQDQSSQGQSGDSLGDIARKLKAQQGQTSTPKPGKVYSNDDIPEAKAAGGVAVASGSKSGDSDASSGKAHGEKYYRGEYSKLMSKKETDQRELEVLQKKLNANDVQYYNDPNKALQQQYSREDINKNQEAVDKKKQDIEADDQALSDLQDQLRHDDGDPSWLQGDPVSIVPDVKEEKPSAEDKGDKKKSKEYWQGKFIAARATLAKAQEAQKLVEDEISLLKARQVQEPSADAQTEINAKLADRQPELEKATAAADLARQNLDLLQKEFDDSGAPIEWSQIE